MLLLIRSTAGRFHQPHRRVPSGSFGAARWNPFLGPSVITAVGPRARFKAPCLGTRHHRGPGHERDSTGAACAHADTAVPAMSATQRSAMPTALTAVPAMSAIPGVRLGLRRHRVRAVRWPPSLGRTSPGSMSPGAWGPHTSAPSTGPSGPSSSSTHPPMASLAGSSAPLPRFARWSCSLHLTPTSGTVEPGVRADGDPSAQTPSLTGRLRAAGSPPLNLGVRRIDRSSKCCC